MLKRAVIVVRVSSKKRQSPVAIVEVFEKLMMIKRDTLRTSMYEMYTASTCSRTQTDCCYPLTGKGS